MFSIVDRGIVHQDADRQRQSAQRHDVDGLPQRAQDDDGSQNRERNRNGDDQRAAPASKEQENHHGREAGSDQGFPHHAARWRARTKTTGLPAA